jgi:hypothetical protein
MPEPNDVETALNQEITPKEQPVPTPEASKTQPAATPDDPELDLGVGEDGQPLKFKKSQILEFRKAHSNMSEWEKSNTSKAQELSAQREELKEMFKILDHLKANPEKAKRIIAILDGKEEVAEEKIDEIDEVLKTLDPNDPYAKTLIALRKQQQELLKTNKELQEKLWGFEQKSATSEQQIAVKQAEQALTKALDDVAKGFTFEDDEDRKEWRAAVLTYMVNNPQRYDTEEDFQKAIGEIGKKEFDALTKRIERITGRYIKKKSDGPAVPTHPGGAGAKPLSAKPTADNLEKVLEESLNQEIRKNTS